MEPENEEQYYLSKKRLISKVKTLKNAVKEGLTELKLKKDEIDSLRQENERINGVLTQKKDICKELEAENEDLKEMVNTKNNTIKSLGWKQYLNKVLLRNLTDDITMFKKQIDIIKRNNFKKLQAFATLNEKRKSELEAVKNELQAVKKEKEQDKTQMAEKIKELEAEKNRNDEMKKKMEEMKMEMDAMKKELDKEKIKNMKMQDEEIAKLVREGRRVSVEVQTLPKKKSVIRRLGRRVRQVFRRE
ncbi:cilia- and flagella-associated protein 58-like [Actinia tenebrosa]|uniref:Cilia- and flagella-associated protein 58-like n=1 Tax=Actinia tenebrosa TaxID=6105 RepID=A0A6P8H961_ACTTE|nr:cilia- and flagella-associated protein 58-like [Actinia tenebrosa]